MRALRIVGVGAVEVAEVEGPVAGDDEVVVTVGAAAVCNTDRKLVRAGRPIGRTLGHEVAGWLADGTPVGVHPDLGCGRCHHCDAGRTNRCPDRRSVGIGLDGGLAEAVAVPRAHAVPLEGVPVELAPLLEPLACGVHAARRLGTVAGPVVVVGAGAMGIVTTWALQAMGHRVAVRQRSEARRRQAADLGADALLDVDQPAVDAFGAPPGAIVVTAPGPDALAWALDEVAEGGVVHAFAGTPGGAPVDANVVHYRHLDLVGSTGSGLADYREARDLVRRGAVALDRLPRRATDLDGAVAAVSTPDRGEDLRVMVELRR